LGVALAFGSTEIRERITRSRARRGHFEALAAEIRMCGAIAKGYLAGKVMSPSYRMPLIGHEQSLPALLAEGVLRQADSEALIRYYNNAKAFNLCLEYCHEALLEKLRDEGADRLDKEVRRTQLKARKLAPGSEHPTQYDDALRVVARNLPRASLRQLEFDAEEQEP
jgi:hypothetical protein